MVEIARVETSGSLGGLPGCCNLNEVEEVA